MAHLAVETSVILKCFFDETGDVMRLRTEWPLCLERVEELLCQAIGPRTVVKYEDGRGQLHALTDETLAQLGVASRTPSPAIVRLRVYGACVLGVPPTHPRGSSSTLTKPMAPSDGKEREAATDAAKENRRRLRQQARRQRRRVLKAQQSQDSGSEDEAAAIRAFDVRDGMELWIESGTTNQLLQVAGDGRVDFDGELEDATAFVVRRPSTGANETAMALQGPGGRYLRRNGCGALECTGTRADYPDCRFSFVDVVDGIVLFLGPPGTGHVLAAPGAAAPRLEREAPPQGFRLLARPLVGPAG